MKKMLEKRLAQLSGEGVSQEDASVMHQPAAIEVAKRHSGKDIVLWLVAITLLIAATLVNPYLPANWQPASNVWTRLIIIVGLVLVAIICLALTNQGSAFKTLLLDSRVELQRVTWPSKAEIIQYTWQVLLGTGILGLLVWILDTTFGQVIKLILG